jgi:hypothetical protein
MQIDWNSVFFPSLGSAEIIVRGTLMYLGLFVILRFMRLQSPRHGKADAGGDGPARFPLLVGHVSYLQFSRERPAAQQHLSVVAILGHDRAGFHAVFADAGPVHLT